MSTEIQDSTLPPAQPVYVLRGHCAQVHALRFLRNNLRLLAGDADGWVVLWDTPIRRAVGVWKAHAGPILGLGAWGEEKIITCVPFILCDEDLELTTSYRHGRDNKLCIWQLRAEDELDLSKTLPIDDSTSERKQPWLLHSLTVNALNFCSFAMCSQPLHQTSSTSSTETSSILIATPGAQDGYVNITSLPTEERVATIPSPPTTKTGMIMAIGLKVMNNILTIIAGYESGHAAIWTQSESSNKWQMKHIFQAHTQPILSLAITPDGKSFFTSSADAIISRHRTYEDDGPESKIVQTRHAGQQSLNVRSDGKIFATAGWDGRVRVYSVKSVQELAVLKWHKEGCYATAFAEIIDTSSAPTNSARTNGEVVKRELTVSEKRTEKAKAMHLLAAGSKDGKISLWEVY